MTSREEEERKQMCWRGKGEGGLDENGERGKGGREQTEVSDWPQVSRFDFYLL